MGYRMGLSRSSVSPERPKLGVKKFHCHISTKRLEMDETVKRQDKKTLDWFWGDACVEDGQSLTVSNLHTPQSVYGD